MSEEKKQLKVTIEKPKFQETMDIMGDGWNICIDFHMDTDKFPCSYHGQVCDIQLVTHSVSVNFFITIGQVRAIKEYLDYRNKNNKKKTPMQDRTRSFSISNLVIKGNWYSIAELQFKDRTEKRLYMTFAEKDFDTDFDESEDLILPYDLVISPIDIEDVCRRILINYELLYEIEKI